MNASKKNNNKKQQQQQQKTKDKTVQNGGSAFRLG